jgi:hypothetical protein
VHAFVLPRLPARQCGAGKQTGGICSRVAVVSLEVIDAASMAARRLNSRLIRGLTGCFCDRYQYFQYTGNR